jgi:xanthine/CO dehydrogenase XdhC/CoxF family maturation factor
MPMREILADVERWRSQGEKVAVATVIEASGSTPRPMGSRMAISSSGEISGSVSGGCIEGAVFQEAQEVLANGQSKVLHYGISDEQAWSVGLSCGGNLGILLERLDW